jgi:hypothetical protein
MRQWMIVVMMIVAVSGMASSAPAEEPSVASLPPVVVKTVPQSGDTKVDPATKTLEVTFSKKMTDKSWSWVGDIDSWVRDKPHYKSDRKTCVLPVKLEPGKTYVVWINSQTFRNFRDAGGRPAVPYLIVFETKKK